MKGFKKLVATASALALATALSVPAFAQDGSYSVTISNDAEGHTYEAYQIFVGDLDDGVLSNIEWGSGVSAEGKAEFGNAASKAETIVTVEDAEAFAQAVSEYLTTPEGSDDSVSADGKYVIDGLDAGYYLIMDQSGSLAGEDDAYTAFILRVAGNTEAAPKTAKPTVEKQVQDEVADAEAGSNDGWGKTADHAINESFQFRVKATLPPDTDFGKYDEYLLIFNETMSNGLTFESIDSVTVNDVAISDYVCTAAAGQVGGDWKLTIEDLTDVIDDLTAGVEAEIVYSVHLNEGAVAGEAVNNTVSLQYSNNPNVGGSSDLGVSAPSNAWAFTYALENTKVDGDDRALADAGFRLYADEECRSEIPLVYDEDLQAYRPAAGSEQGVEMTSAKDTGKFNIVGLDAGFYYLRETSTPAGYNTCDDIAIVISAAHSMSASSVPSVEVTLTVDGEQATANKVVNLKGATLPSTGGMGSTLFYVAGAILVIGAGVALVARRRTEDSE